MPTLTAASLNQALTSSHSKRIKKAVHRTRQGVLPGAARLPLSLPKGSSLRPQRLCVKLSVPPPQPVTNILLDNSIPNCHAILIEKCARDFSCAGFPLNLKFDLSGELLCPLTRTAPARASFSSPTAAAASCPHPPTTWASAISTPKNSRIASTPRKPASRSTSSSAAISSPPATSPPPSPPSSPPPPWESSNPRPPSLSPISASLCSKPRNSPKRNSYNPSTTVGPKSSGNPSSSTSPLPSPSRPPNLLS